MSPVTHRPSLPYPLTALTPEGEQIERAHASYYGHPQYFQHASNLGIFARRKPGPWMTKFFRLPKSGLSTLCTGLCLPCVLYGKTQYRLKQMADGEDPLDTSKNDVCNGPCWMFGMIMCCIGFDCKILLFSTAAHLKFYG